MRFALDADGPIGAWTQKTHHQQSRRPLAAWHARQDALVIAVDAARIRVRYPVSLPDAPLLATARGLTGRVPSYDTRVLPAAKAEEIAAGAGLGCTIHAGEWQGPVSVRDALRLPVSRLDHGVRASEDPALVRELAARGITLNVCPTSNLALGVYRSLSDHPLPHLHAAGVRVTLGSDDPPYFGATLAGEYALCAEQFGWSEQQLRALTAAAIDAAFCEERLKVVLRERLHAQ